MIFFNQSNDYTSFYNACINFCVNITDTIKFCVIIKDALRKKMPYTLKQLEERRDSCVTKIQELKESAKDKGAEQLRSFTFHAIKYFNELVKSPEEEIDSFLSLFPELPKIFECARQASKQEKRRRRFEEQIAKLRMEKGMQVKRFLEDEQKKELTTRKRLRMLTGATGTGEGTSQTMN